MSKRTWLRSSSGPAAAGSAVLALAGLLLGWTQLDGSTVNAAVAAPTPSPTCAGNSSRGNGANCNGAGNGNGGAAGSANKTFAISGAVTGLVPGAARSITLTLTNNGPQAVLVQALTVSATGVPGCAASYLGLGTGFTAGQGTVSPTGLKIPGNGTVTTGFPVKLLGAAPNSCKSVTFTLTYGGTAAQA